MKRLLFSATLCCLVMHAGNIRAAVGGQEVQTPSLEKINDISIVHLISAPERYQGKYVRVIGYVWLEFEGDAIYLSMDDHKYGVTKNGLWLDVPGKAMADAKRYGGKFCLVEGTFNSANHGHMGLWSGAIENIKRIQVWKRK